MTRHTSFWDRRRAAVRAEEETELRAAQAQIEAEEQAVLAEKTDAELLIEFDLPDPDTLKAGDDFTAFMSRAIPEHLRRRALRKLWVSNPILACLDDLVDYADDYTQASAVTDFTTSYEVGKGLRRHIEDVAKKALAQTKQEPEQDEDPVLVEEPQALALAEAPCDPASQTDADDAADSDADVAPVLMPRRMAFRFEEHST